MKHDIAGQKVKVLPLLLRGGVLPEALAGKLFADFTSELAYQGSLQSVLARVGVHTPSPTIAADRLDGLASSSGLLKSVLAELRGSGISKASADALVYSQIDDFDLSEFLSLVTRELQGAQLFGLATAIVPLIDSREVGQEALDFCLTSGRLERWQIVDVGMYMQYVTTPTAVRWCHDRLTSHIRSDDYYHSFIVRHIDTVIEHCHDDMAAYLLHPYRGPSNYNIDSFGLVICSLNHPLPFQRRFIDWINDGYFDGGDMEGGESADTLYQVLNSHWSDPRLSDIAEAVHSRVHSLLKSRSKERIRAGMYHLVAMVDAMYQGSGHVVDRTLSRVYDLGGQEETIFLKLRTALEAIASYNSDPHVVERERIRNLYVEIAGADRSGITGYWSS